MSHHLNLDGWWGDRSVLLNKNCILYKLKKNYVSKLFEKGLLTVKDMDIQNETPHIQITNNSQPKDQNAYLKIDKSSVKVSMNVVQFHDNYISIPTGNSGITDTHMTLVFCKSLKFHIEEFKKVLEEVLIQTLSNELSAQMINDELQNEISFEEEMYVYSLDLQTLHDKYTVLLNTLNNKLREKGLVEGSDNLNVNQILLITEKLYGEYTHSEFHVEMLKYNNFLL